MKMNLHDQRIQYGKTQLIEDNLPENPIELFHLWFELAQKSNVLEPNAMVLATVNNNKPSARVVLLKEITTNEFVFFTHYKSRKGREIEKNPFACLTFFWPELEKQIRIEGVLSMTDKKTSASYFDSRPIESRISAAVSNQSQIIASRQELEKRWTSLKQSPQLVKCPENWGGYRLTPHTIEFWQGRENRLHDRIQYVRIDSKWSKHRLAP